MPKKKKTLAFKGLQIKYNYRVIKLPSKYCFFVNCQKVKHQVSVIGLRIFSGISQQPSRWCSSLPSSRLFQFKPATSLKMSFTRKLSLVAGSLSSSKLPIWPRFLGTQVPWSEATTVCLTAPTANLNSRKLCKVAGLCTCRSKSRYRTFASHKCLK